jgi:O-antigen/teichoic acid export membrane protein
MLKNSTDLRDLDRRIASGLAWTGGVKGLAQIVSWMMTILVMRLLTPTDYGIFGLATLFTQITGMAAEFGLGSVLVYLRELDALHTAQLHGFSLLLGAVGVGLAGLAAYPFGAFFHAPALAPVILVLATTFLIDSARTVPAALLARDMRFKQLAALDLVKAIVVPVVTAGFALAGYAYWALVFGVVTSSLVSTMMVLAWHPQRVAWPRVRELRPALSFGVDVIVARLAWWGYSNADFTVAGRVLGAEAVGVYNCAWTIACSPMEKVVSVFTRVMPALFSRVKYDPALVKRYFASITEVITLLITPACLGLAAVADDFIPVVLGAKWLPAVVPLRLLCCYAAVQGPTTLFPHILNAAGKTRLAMSMNLLILAILPASFVLGANARGATGIAAIWVIVYPALLVPLWRATLVAVGGTVREYVQTIWPALGGSIVMLGVVVLVRYLADGMPAVVRLAIGASGGAAAYSATILLLYRSRIHALRGALAGLWQSDGSEGSTTGLATTAREPGVTAW